MKKLVLGVVLALPFLVGAADKDEIEQKLVKQREQLTKLEIDYEKKAAKLNALIEKMKKERERRQKQNRKKQ